MDSNDKPGKKVESKPVVEDKADGAAKGKSGKVKILVLFVLVVVIAGCAAFYGYARYKGSTNLPHEPVPEEVKATLALEPFLVNLADPEEVRYVKSTFSLGLAEEPEEGANNSVAIATMRDSIISLLSSKKAEQILTPEGKEALRKEIRARVNSVSPKLNVLEVYIIEFVVQL